MAFNYRYSLKIATDLALGLFLVFASGAVLWTADEFLNWNLLPDFIDKYAQLIVVVFGIAAAMAVSTTVLSSMVLHAEAACLRAGIPDYTIPKGTWKIAIPVALLAGTAFILFYQLDAYRKGVALTEQRAGEFGKYREAAQDLASAVKRFGGLFPEALLRALDAGAPVEGDAELIRFLSAVRFSTAHQPTVGVLVRASPPYEYCYLQLVIRPDKPAEGPSAGFQLKRQFYLGFPSPDESEAIRQLFAGQVQPVTARLQGEVIDTVRPAGWETLRVNGRVAALLVLKNEQNPPFDFRHFGPATPL